MREVRKHIIDGKNWHSINITGSMSKCSYDSETQIRAAQCNAEHIGLQCSAVQYSTEQYLFPVHCESDHPLCEYEDVLHVVLRGVHTH